MTTAKVLAPVTHTCHCTGPSDWCERFKRLASTREREICRGDNVDAATAADYRHLWESEAKGERPAAAPPPASCPHLGQEQRDAAGELVTRECPSCGGGKTRLKLFACGHPAREPDQVTVQDCQACDYRPRDETQAKPLILRNHLSPGDVLCMTAAIHSLHKQYPGKFLTAVDTTCNAVFEHNPDVTPIDKARQLGAETVEMHYPLVNECNSRAVHVLQGYCDFLESKLGVRVPLLTNRPHVYLSKKERSWLDQVAEVTGRKQPFFVLSAGRKNDYTTKFWGAENYQRVVDALRGRVLFVQVGAAEHYHPPLRNVLNLVGKTDTRQLVRLAWHAAGGLGGVTFIQHLMAAVEKPYVCVMGGREPVNWNAYPRQQLLHTVGAMPCCKTGGCWRSRVVPLGDGSEQDRSLCEQPVIGEEVIPRCMAMIRPEEVAEKILLFAP